MYTDPEKLNINFPNVSFERQSHDDQSVRVVVPNFYVASQVRDTAYTVNTVKALLSRMKLHDRNPYLLMPLEAEGDTEDSCASKIIDTIRQEDVDRHVKSRNDVVTPKTGVIYYPVYEDDPFHRHDDPEFIDLAPVTCKDAFQPDEDPELFDMLYEEHPESPSTLPKDEVIAFDVSYGDGHAHFIDAHILARRLAL